MITRTFNFGRLPSLAGLALAALVASCASTSQPTETSAPNDKSEQQTGQDERRGEQPGSDAPSNGQDENKELRRLTNNKLALRIGESSMTITLYDNPTADDLLTKLPLTLKANNYAGYDEKVIRLPFGLSMKDAPPGDNPEIPEVGYYEPGRWIALYYGPIGYWPGKVPLGRIDASIEQLRAIPDNASVTIERMKQ